MREDQLELGRRVREYATKPAPFNLSVHSYSNLTLDAALQQGGFAPGNAVSLNANLWEYRAPLATAASIWADVIQPDGSRATLPFSRTSAGDYAADWLTKRPGVYQFVIHAEGRTTGNARFTRTKLLTAGVWAGGDRPFDPTGGQQGDAAENGFCEMILCLVEQAMKSPRLEERFKEIGFDLDRLRRCIEIQCRKGQTPMEGQRAAVEASQEWRMLTRSPEFNELISTLVSSGLAELKLLEPPETKPVPRKPRMKGSNENMFVLPDEPKKPRGKKKRTKIRNKKYPRMTIQRMA